MDTRLIFNPLYPVNLPDGFVKEMLKGKEEKILFDTEKDTGDGKYNVILEFDLLPLKSYAFNSEVNKLQQDRDGDLLYNILASSISKLRVFKICDNENIELKWSDVLLDEPSPVMEEAVVGETRREASEEGNSALEVLEERSESRNQLFNF